MANQADSQHKTWWLAAGALLIIGVLGFAVIHAALSHHAEDPGIVRPLSPAVKKTIYVTKLSHPTEAPNFTLVDQHGKRVSLHQFHGKAVILEFLDPRCTDVCPLVSEEMLIAQRRLGAAGKHVAYVAVNVNAAHHKVSDVEAFTKAHGLNALSNFYFLTGPPAKLKAIWKTFFISVLQTKSGDVQHSPAMYFLDPAGRERFLGEASGEKASVTDWGIGMAYYLRRLL